MARPHRNLRPATPEKAIASRRKTRIMRGMRSICPQAPRVGPERTRGLTLGVDPGLQRTGYALVADGTTDADARLIEAGFVRLPRQQPLPARLVELEESLVAVIEKHRPAILACEELYAHYKHPRTAILMAHCRGVILALAARRGLHVVSIAATNVKRLLTGSGRAGKRQVQRAVAATLRLARVPEPHDVADAIAIALCGLRLRQAELASREARRSRR